MNLDTTEIIKLEKQLKTFGRLALPFAARNAVNDTGVILKKNSFEHVRKEMTLRNRWTQNSLKLFKAKSLTIDKQVARFGSLQDYMFDQEYGGTRTTRRSSSIPIPTGDATGESGNRGRLQKLAKGKNKLLNIQLLKTRGKRLKTRRQRNAATVAQAIRTKQKYVYMETEKSKGIFKIVSGGGGRKGSKQRKRENRSRVRLLWNMKHRRISVPPRPWLRPAIEEVLKIMPAVYVGAMQNQLDRYHLFKD